MVELFVDVIARVDKLLDPMRKASEVIGEFQNKTKRLNKAEPFLLAIKGDFDQIGDALDATVKQYGSFDTQFARTIGNSFSKFDGLVLKQKEVEDGAYDMRKPMDRLKKSFGDLGKASNKTLKNIGGFRYEFLGTMFAGMALANAMQGLLQPALEATGIFDVWGATLEVVFLPVALMLLDFVLWLSDVLMNMPESVKMVIGAIVLFGLILGTALMFVSQLVLGIMSLIAALPFIGGLLGPLTAGFAALIPMIGISGKDMDGLKKIFQDFVGPIGETINKLVAGNSSLKWAFELISALLRGDFSAAWNMILAKITEVVTGIFNTVKTWIDKAIGYLIGEETWGKVKSFFAGIWKWVKDFWGAEDKFEFLRIWIGKAFGKVLEFFGLKKTADDFFKAIDDMVKLIEDGKWTELASYIFGKLLGGLMSKVTATPTNRPVIDVAGFFEGIAKWIGDRMPHAQEGGFTGNYSGPVMLHPNEFIIPQEKMSQFAPNVSVNVNTTGGVDGDLLAQQIMNRMRIELRSRSMA